jgi:hypothetical protein
VFVYLLVGPTGKSYVGITKSPEKRWSSHKRKAETTPDKRHPLYDSMRKHGCDSFKMEVVVSGLTLEEAKAAEVSLIQTLGTNDPSCGYNVSRGGEYDGADGSKKFWEDIRKDPVIYARYIARLREGCLKRDSESYRERMKQNHAKWRKDNARQAYYMGRRAIRCANRQIKILESQGLFKRHSYTPTEEQRQHQSRVQSERWERTSASEKKRKSIESRKHAFRQWAERTEEQRLEVARKISESRKRWYENPGEIEKVSKQLAEARKNVDRKKQGAAASAGLRRYWAELKSDPVAWEAHLKKKSDSAKAAAARRKAKNERV